MGYYVSHMIGLRTGGVFSGGVDTEDMRERISSYIKKINKNYYGDDRDKKNPSESYPIDIHPSVPCMSRELSATKGSYVVIAGVFNHWHFEDASKFSKALSLEFGTEVMHMCWDEEVNEINCEIFLDGKPLIENSANPLGQILRRIT